MSVEIQKITVIEAPHSFNSQDNVDFLDIVEKAIDTGVRTININCTKLKYMSSSQVSLIWQANLMCKEADVKMILCNVHKTIIGVLHTMDLYELFIIKEAVDISVEETNIEKISSRSISMFSKKFAPKSENIMHIKYLLNQHLLETQLDEQFIYEIETIFYEITTNIRLHAKTTKLGVIEFNLSQEKNYILLKFIDNGIPFDISKYKSEFDPHQAIISKKRNGLGIHMINKMTDKVSYKRIDDKNYIELKKVLRGEYV